MPVEKIIQSLLREQNSFPDLAMLDFGKVPPESSPT
jgi:hypothetical protein